MPTNHTNRCSLAVDGEGKTFGGGHPLIPMKSKTINSWLCKKFDDFLASITDEKVRELVKNNTIITGGSIVSMLLGDKVNDYDMYFRNKETVLAVAKYYVEKFKACPPTKFKNMNKEVSIFVCDCDNYMIDGDGVKPRKTISEENRPLWSKLYADTGAYNYWKDETDYLLNRGRVKIVVRSAGLACAGGGQDYQYFESISNLTEQAESTSSFVDQVVKATENADDQPAAKLDEEEATRGKYCVQFLSSNAVSLSNKVQLIVRFYGEPDEIHKNYDFAHCTSYWTSWERKLTLRPEAMEAILSRELRYIGSRYPICSMIRTRKFLGRGWTINAGQYVKMAWQVSQLDLDNVAVLEDQLVGVDAAYFMQVIALLRQQPDPEKVDGAYLMTVIDKLF
jgi:HEPN domain-containing protein